jgi:CheY-like chemotaxis protein
MGILDRFKDKTSYTLEISNKHLIVDDSEINRVVLEQFLELFGIVSDVAVNGQEGFDKTKETNYDIIWMDIIMPIMNGLESTKILRKLGFTGPIIGITGCSEIISKKKCKNAGMNMMLEKPINKTNISNIIFKYSRVKS